MVWHAVCIIVVFRQLPWCVGTGDAGFSVDTASLTLDPEQETQALFESAKPVNETKGGGVKGSNQQAGTCFLLTFAPVAIMLGHLCVQASGASTSKLVLVFFGGCVPCIHVMAFARAGKWKSWKKAKGKFASKGFHSKGKGKGKKGKD